MNTDSDSSAHPNHPRKPHVAALLSLLRPGLGHLYAGRPKLAAVWVVVRLLVVAALAVVVVVWGTSVSALALVVAQAWVIAVACAISATIAARSAPHPYVLRSYNRKIVYLVFFVVVALLSAGAGELLRRYVVEAFKFPTKSMLPTVLVGDHIFANKTTHGVDAAEPGNMIVFRFPNQLAADYLRGSDARCIDSTSLGEERRMMKRVVAVGGDDVERLGGTLFINGRKVLATEVSRRVTGNEFFPYETEYRETLGNGAGHRVRTNDADPDFGLLKVPPDHVFVLGDSRSNSSDSSCWGFVPADHIEGVVTHVWWSSGEDGIRWERVGLELD